MSKYEEEVWSLINDQRDRLGPGGQITCSLFGRIKPVHTGYGYVGEIPASLRAKALQHGLMVIGADYTSDTYAFKVLLKPKEPVVEMRLK